jgi:anaerobic selenocysteine-containing dehydrogenase/Fe-S-cluster-containing dehydrogenase component
MDEATRRSVNRRTFLKVAGVAGLATGCSSPGVPQRLVPYLDPPEDIIPGRPLFYRTACRECPAGCGVTARTREGRVVKLEGNPEDPIGRGTLCARGQAAVQGLYAPDRLRGPVRRGPEGKSESVTWDAAIAALAGQLAKAPAGSVRLLSRSEPGSAGALQRSFLAALGASPEQRVVLDPFDPAPLRAAGGTLFGRPELPTHDLASARTVISFGADFVETWLSPVEMARDFASGRGRVGPERTRLVWIGPRRSLTGASADIWLPARPGSEPWVALGLLRWLCDPSNRVGGLAAESGRLFDEMPGLDPAKVERRSGVSPSALARLGAELDRRRPSAVLGPGVLAAGAGVGVLALAVQLLNWVLGNVGKTVLYGLDPREDPPSPPSAFRSLIADMEAGGVAILLVHHADPVGSLPTALGVASALARVPLVVSFSGWLDPTTLRAHLVLPDHHPLESFGDVSPRRGIVALSQPVMNPLWDTRSASQTLLDVWAKLAAPKASPPAAGFHDFFFARLASLLPGLAGDELDAARRAALARGGVYAKGEPVAVQLTLPRPSALDPPPGAAPDRGPLAVVTYPTVLRHQGPGADSSWLREVPDPLSTVSWVGWAEVAPATARRLGIAEGDLLRVSTEAGAVELPAYVYPGLMEDVVAVPLRGIEPLPLLPAPGAGADGFAWIASGAAVARTGRRVPLPKLEGVPYQEGREIVRTVTEAAPVLGRPPQAGEMYPRPRFPEHRWAMAIDLDRCTGCQACVVACYAENNVPVAGPEAMTRGRNMGWIRLEHFFREGPGETAIDFLPMLCQHCTNAPCEPVCPVYATYTNAEGLNAQIYNRCVGTRYCSNNCPYKVRTFNWYDPSFPTPLNLQLNPDVSVRSMGVMEKCSFCAQRIRAAEIAAKTAGRILGDGEVVPACVETCPTGAMVFGDANDPASRVAALQRDGRGYHVLEEVNTLPAITYLARVRT